MIRVTVWNENIHDRTEDAVKRLYPDGMHQQIAAFLREDAEFTVRTATLDMPQQGLSREIIADTDVMIWWGHKGHKLVIDEAAERVREAVLRGMGLIVLHSGHFSKPFRLLMGTSCTLNWRDGDRERLWCCAPGHPIAKGIPEHIELDPEEMYSEYFDIPKPDDVVYLGWFAGGEAIRAGVTFTRGYGKIFYFQPGHETNPTLQNPWIQQILRNAVHWANSQARAAEFTCLNPDPLERGR